MGRRALRKPDPSLSLEPHHLEWDRLPQPWRAVQLFGRVAPLEVEIGSGKGLFLTSSAQQRPEHNFLGCEIAAKYAAHAAGRLAKAGLANARLLHGDARRLMGELLPDASCRAVHVYFPDPWWKKRHHKRRIMNEPFVRHIERVLEPGGRLHFWTDVAEYFELALDTLAAQTQLVGPLAVAEKPAEHDLDYRTHFERRMRLNNEAVYRSEFMKNAGPEPSPADESPASSAGDTVPGRE